MTALPIPIAEKIGKLVGRLGSNHDGEVLATGRAIERTLKGAGLDLHVLAEHVAAPPPRTIVVYRDRPAERPAGPRSYGSWREAWRRPGPDAEHKAIVARCQCLAEGRASAWEMTFLDSLALRLAQGRSLTAKQAAVLLDIDAKFGGQP